jgi:hypothetical protein
MVEYKEGAEKAPIQHKLPILAIVYSLRENDKIVVEKRFNYSSYEDRKALGALSYWAYTNHCSIETIAVSDAEAEVEENKE